ncbi:unnamed protein product [Wuchereria bancrofti]|uniref:Uncharacterized protein n=1 Tax=Wuchereria bancrofti TaxID=6293 RepID=A0A3P7DEG4_WUCBA|nr:unnamed protein product [Wuchereria bancrofti]
MKESSVGRIAFGICVSLTMVFTLISLLTPANISAWRTFEKRPEALNQGPAIPASIGLFRYQCFGNLQKEDGKISKGKRPDNDFCNYIFDNRAAWDVMVVYTLISSLIIELIAILYLFLPREFCCEHYEHMAAPFSIFASTIFILLIYGVITYAERYAEISILLEAFSQTEGHSGLRPSMIIIGLGYSYYLLCIAFVFSFLSLIIGILNVTLAWCFLW